ncbi:MAG: DUF86 domain-containing protein [Chloroflexota bacterium]|nr:DUF86 domain-containing protein [Chloroflexota bacterium]
MRKSPRNDRSRLHDMLHAARITKAFVDSTDRHAVESNVVLQSGLAKLIQDIGEAANRVTSEFQARHSHVPWRDMIDMRNHLVHVYTDIDFDVLWKTAVEDLPPLISQLETILEKED